MSVAAATTTTTTTAAAAAAMQEAFGDGELAIVKSILAQITAEEDEPRAKEVVCETVANLLMTNKLLYSLSPDDDIWETLARNVFPDAPDPYGPDPEPERDDETTRRWGCSRCRWREQGCNSARCRPKPPHDNWWVPMPANKMDYFYTMGARHRNARLAKEKLDYLKAKDDEYYQAFYEAMMAATHPHNRDMETFRVVPTRRQLDRLCWTHVNLHHAVENYEDNQVYEANCFLENWHGCRLIPPRLRRRNAERYPSWLVQPYPESSDDEADA